MTGFGPLAVAYAAAKIARAIPITPGGLGVIEVTLVAVTVGFGAQRPTAVLAVLGYRVINYWLPLLPGAAAYLRLRLSQKTGKRAKPATAPPGNQKPSPICLSPPDIGQRQRFPRPLVSIPTERH